jgi:hypothetical protein
MLQQQEQVDNSVAKYSKEDDDFLYKKLSTNSYFSIWGNEEAAAVTRGTVFAVYGASALMALVIMTKVMHYPYSIH